MHDPAAAVQTAPMPRLSLDWFVLMGGVLSLTVAVLATIFGPEQTRTAGTLDAGAQVIRTEG